MKKNKPNFILLVGSDGAGKSTVANKLNEALGYEVHHFGPPKNYEDGKQQYFGFIEKTDTDVICDRFHEGEKVYAPIYRGYEADYFPELEKALMEKFNVLLVLVYAPFPAIEQRLKERGEDFVKPQHFQYAFEKVIEIFNESNLPKMMIDTSLNSVEQNVEKILKRIL